MGPVVAAARSVFQALHGSGDAAAAPDKFGAAEGVNGHDRGGAQQSAEFYRVPQGLAGAGDVRPGGGLGVTRAGGVVFAAYVISDGCLLDEGFLRGNVNVAEYVEKGLLDPRTFAARSEPKDLFELVRREDVDRLMSAFPVTRLHYVASDGCALLLREAIDAMDDSLFRLYLDYHLATCEREDLVGVTSHALDIFRK